MLYQCHTGDHTVGEWCRLWFETYSQPNLQPNTVRNYANVLEQHIIPVIGGVKLRLLMPIHIQQMYNDIREHGRVRRSKKKEDFTLSASFVRRTHIYDYLKECLRDELMVVFLFSKAFYDSNVCISEAGAAWATNRNCLNAIIDIGFGDIEKLCNNALSSIIA